MDANEYQYRALSTLMPLYSTKEALVYCVLGLAGESSKVSEHIKKWVYHGHALDKTMLKFFLGHVLYHIAVAAHKLGYTLSEVMEYNLDKLTDRYPEGFTQECSRNRDNNDNDSS